MAIMDGSSLGGRTALITGASQGIGAAIALCLARAGADIVLVARNAALLRDVASRAAVGGAGAEVLPADLSDPSDLDRVAARAANADILVNNAAVAQRYLRFTQRDDAYWRSVIEVNFWATYVLMREAARGMTERGGGCIVNITSSAGVRANPFLAHYSSTKAAVEMLTKVAAMELGEHGVRVLNVAPGWIDTTHPALTDEGKARLADDMPLKRAGRPEEVGELVAFLASDQASYLSGSTILCDGALLAGNYDRAKLLRARLQE
jgi:NAD(P)-dependent dehydrogenase (short-subunit alcohol dehydrogenase family)